MTLRRHLLPVLATGALLATGATAAAKKDPITRQDLKPISKDTSREPRVPRQRQGPPRRLIRKTIVRGSGAQARTGDQLTVQYTGYALSTGKRFDTSWRPGREPLTFTLGAGDVIAGWERGLVGLRVGGRRELVIPARLAYGRTGAPPAIRPGETLIFVVDRV